MNTTVIIKDKNEMIYSPVIAASAASHNHTIHYSDIEKINDAEYNGTYLKCVHQQDNSIICGEYYHHSSPTTSGMISACLVILLSAILFCVLFGINRR